jgi:hypothetical protein
MCYTSSKLKGNLLKKVIWHEKSKNIENTKFVLIRNVFIVYDKNISQSCRGNFQYLNDPAGLSDR